ncbi:MAG: dockerin type I domain-containing protein [Candidatus Zixiibacteriota bacterium]
MITRNRLAISFTLVFCFIIISATNAAWLDGPISYPTSLAKDTLDYIYVGATGGIFKSTDNGTTFDTIASGAEFLDPFSMTVNPVTNSIFLAVEAGVYRSQDGGLNWTKLDNSIGGTYSLRARNDGLVIAAGSAGILYSTDNGDSWTLGDSQLGPFHNGIAFSESGTIFITTMLDGLIRSTDNGATWENISAGFTTVNSFEDVVTDNANGIVYVTAFHMFYQTPTYNLVFRSYDEGNTWEQVDSIGGISLGMGIDENGNVFSGRHPAVYSKDQGNTWIDISDGIPQGDRLVSFLPINDGKFLIADMDDALKIGQFACCEGMRGNADGSADDAVNIGDAIFLINHIFKGGSAPTCGDEADVDAGGAINIGDAVYLLNYIFKGGPEPASCE